LRYVHSPIVLNRGILQRPGFALEPRSTAQSGAQSTINKKEKVLENLRNAQYNFRILARTCKRASKSAFGDHSAHRNKNLVRDFCYRDRFVCLVVM
jgi:hypothetical protein